MTTDTRLRTYCCAPGCVEPAEGAVVFAYVHEQRHHLCSEHMRPIRAALLPVLRPPSEQQLDVHPDEQLVAVIPGGDDDTGYAT